MIEDIYDETAVLCGYNLYMNHQLIKTKILPENAVCIRGAQCQSGKCFETNNETTYGYCSAPIV